MSVKPVRLSFEEAAAVPMAAVTALQGLRHNGETRPGQAILINGASGGVGTFAVQIAKSYGPEVSAVTSPRNIDLVRSLGADHVIDYTSTDFVRTGRRYDLILDTVGNRSARDLRSERGQGCCVRSCSPPPRSRSSSTHRVRVRLIGGKNMQRDQPGVVEDDVTMRAIVQDSYGPAERWRLAEIAEPEIADSEVLVNVHAAGIDRGTWHAMTGLPYLGRLYFGLRKPKRPVPGLDVAGTVAAIGADVTRFAVGDEVFGISKGSFAEHASARQDKLVPKPANITFEQAAVVAISGLTALQSLRDAGRIKAGQHVLIIGASGGVGTFAVQIAKTFGAEVTGVCSTTKTELVTSIGADHVIDYTQDDFAHGPQRYNLIIDIGGNSSLTRLRRALTPRGTVVIVGGEDSGRWTGMGRQLRALALSPFVRQRLTIRIPKETHADIELLAELSEAGQLTPVIDRTYPLADAADAMRYLEAGQARGKIAIAV